VSANSLIPSKASRDDFHGLIAAIPVKECLDPIIVSLNFGALFPENYGTKGLYGFL
jgi:hypothetical protein